MKRFIIFVALMALFFGPAASAKPGQGKPTHGCDQAQENDGDPYDSTCDGSPSQNGNGNGNGNQPCAGCVGAADNKNPPGQAPDGSDNNNGYECDANNGVGKGNPAHSGCEPYSGKKPQTKVQSINGSNASALELGNQSTITGATLVFILLAGLILIVGVRFLVHRRVSRSK